MQSPKAVGRHSQHPESEPDLDVRATLAQAKAPSSQTAAWAFRDLVGVILREPYAVVSTLEQA
jgi:hypothetical protein